MVRLTLIARTRDGLPLAEGLDGEKEHDMYAYKSQAKVGRAVQHWGRAWWHWRRGGSGRSGSGGGDGGCSSGGLSHRTTQREGSHNNEH